MPPEIPTSGRVPGRLQKSLYWVLAHLRGLLPRALKGPSEGRTTFVLLLLSVMVAVLSVGRTHWAPTAGLYVLAFGGVVVGFLLAKTRFRESGLVVAGVLVGISISLYYLSSLGEGLTGLARYTDVGSRLFTGDRFYAGSGVSFDRLLAGFFFLFFSWLAGFICSWSFFRRHNIWGAVLPSGVIVVITVAVLPLLAQRLLLYLYLFIVCLLMARLFTLERDRDWDKRGVRRRYPKPVLLPRVFGFALAIVAIASLLPTPPAAIAPVAPIWSGITSPVRPISDESDEVTPNAPVENPIAAPCFEDTSPFSGNVTLEEQPVLMVTAPFPVYLRARSYDVYTHAGWETSDTQMISPESSTGDETEPGSQKSQQIELSVKVLFTLTEGQSVYLAGYPIDMSVDYQLEALQPARYEISISDNQTELAMEEKNLPLDLSQAVSRLCEMRIASHGILTESDIRSVLPEDVQIVSYESGTKGVEKVTVERDVPIPPDTVSVRTTGVSAGSSYRATVSVPTATENELQAAGTEYPGWVLDRYLQLPNDMPSRTIDLAYNLTRDCATPYDKAVAICDYLRTLQYTVDVQVPPKGTDGVDYFLFDTKAGYCQYFASAMAVLLRAVGIPSRMVTGYGPGEFAGDYLPFNPHGAPQGAQTFVVQSSHAWSEAFFPGYGWMQFEATPTYPPVVYGKTNLPPQDAGDSDGNDNPAVEPGGTESGTPWDVRLLVIPLGLGLFCAIGWLGWKRLLGRVSEPHVAYARMGYLAALSGLGPKDNLTPQEYGRKLAEAVPRMEAALNRIVHIYVRASYSNHDLSGEDSSEIAEAWPRVRNSLLGHAVRTALSLRFLKKSPEA
jgi:transglutaminase-like putative cysteine protease